MIWLYSGFVVFVLVMLALDLFVVNRKPHAISIKAAVFWTGVCIVLALAFSLAVFQMYEHNTLGIGDAARERNAYMITSRSDLPQLRIGAPIPELPAEPGKTAQQIEALQNSWENARSALGAPGRTVAWQATLEFLSGWLIEYSLSLDNIFVIAIIFAHFAIPKQYQHRVLFWGILGALIMRGIMIALGAVLIMHTCATVHAGDYRLQWYWSEDAHRDMESPAWTAVDSIPAIFAITQDPFLVFTSNVFAILGLRSLYFALAAMMDKFRFIKHSLAIVLAFIGVKMILLYWHIHLPTAISLAVIISVLGSGVLASLLIPPKAQLEAANPTG